MKKQEENFDIEEVRAQDARKEEQAEENFERFVKQMENSAE